MGTVACQEIGGRVQVSGTVHRETRAIRRKLDCLNPNLQSIKRRIRRHDAWRRRRPLHLLFHTADATPGDGAIPSEGIQGDEWGA